MLAAQMLIAVFPDGLEVSGEEDEDNEPRFGDSSVLDRVGIAAEEDLLVGGVHFLEEGEFECLLKLLGKSLIVRSDIHE